MATRIEEIMSRLWDIADNLRANSGLRASEYSEPMLGLIFLRFANERFNKITAEIQAEMPEGYKITEDDYIVRGTFIIPPQAHFDALLKLSAEENMGEALNNAMRAIEEKIKASQARSPKATRVSPTTISRPCSRLLLIFLSILRMMFSVRSTNIS